MSEIVLSSLKSSLSEGRPLDQVLPFAAEACDQLTHMNAKFAPMCKDITQDNLFGIIALLNNAVSPKVIAELLDHCDEKAAHTIRLEDLKPSFPKPLETIPASNTFSPPEPKREDKENADDSVECSACVRVMNYIDSMLVENSTEREIELALEVVCQYLPGLLKDECNVLIEKYTPLLVKLIVSDLPPAQICQALGLCPRIDTNVAAKTQVSLLPPRSKIECSICARVMTYVDAVLVANSTVEEIEHALEAVCNFVPDSPECKDLIDQYAPLLVQMIVAEFTPVQICQALGMCPRSLLAQSLKTAGPVALNVNSLECSLCVNVMNYVDSLLLKNSTEKEIEQALERVCAFFPGALRTECDALIETYMTILVKLIVAEFTPNEICQAIGLCPAVSPKKVVHQKSLSPASPKKVLKPAASPCETVKANDALECMFCKQVFNYVDAFITKNSTEAEIEQALERVCAFLPTSVRTECDTIIEQYTPTLIHLIVADFTPQEICQALGLCSASAQQRASAKQFGIDVAEKKSVKGIECSMCVHLMNYLDDFLMRNSSVIEIEQVLERICYQLPASYKTKCGEFIENYTPYLINLFVAELSPVEICQSCRMCPAMRILSQRVPHFQRIIPMSSAQCKKGPAHWCQTVETAKSCGVYAMLVCHRMYWGKH
jgi:saposin